MGLKDGEGDRARQSSCQEEHEQAERLCLSRIDSFFILLLYVLTMILGSVPVLYTGIISAVQGNGWV